MNKKLKRILKNTVPLVIYLVFCIIVDVYNKIAGISTVLAALMTTICVVGMKLSNNQQKVDQSVDWLKRIWIAWAIINGIGAFLAYVRPLLAGLATIQ